jgi:GTP diphosphokinase / guanosine-3',5'-bis(diphosphate) 3'-diphosphatase
MKTIDTVNASMIFSALKFSADKHAKQRRKGPEDTPYINHPIEVAEILINVAAVSDTNTLVAALLHDTIEDTDTRQDELESLFGSSVLALVMECTDDKSLPKADRKRLQVEHAPHKSPQAKLIKIADKISNVRDIVKGPPVDWSFERIQEYLDWSECVVSGLRGENAELDELYDTSLKSARKRLERDSAK